MSPARVTERSSRRCPSLSASSIGRGPSSVDEDVLVRVSWRPQRRASPGRCVRGASSPVDGRASSFGDATGAHRGPALPPRWLAALPRRGLSSRHERTLRSLRRPGGELAPPLATALATPLRRGRRGAWRSARRRGVSFACPSVSPAVPGGTQRPRARSTEAHRADLVGAELPGACRNMAIALVGGRARPSPTPRRGAAVPAVEGLGGRGRRGAEEVLPGRSRPP